MKLKNVAVGMRVVAEAGEDTDSGVVLDLNPESATGHEVLVGWDSCSQNWTEVSALEPE